MNRYEEMLRIITAEIELVNTKEEQEELSKERNLLLKKIKV